MVRNRELRLISDVEKLLDTTFPDGWIDSLDWSDEEKSKASFFEGQKKIEDFEKSLFVLFSMTVLQGDHLRFTFSDIDALLDKCASDIVEDDNKSKNTLQNRYRQSLQNLRSAITLVKFHFEITSEFFSCDDSKRQVINFIEISQSSRNENPLVSILDTIIEICNFEYRFSYDPNRIRDLLVCREHLLKSKNTRTDPAVCQCIDCAISKVDMSLLKLSHFTKGKKIEYKFNFVSTVVDPTDSNPPVTDEYSNYLKFIDPENYIKESDVYTWQTHNGKKWARLGQMVLLMRYYTKVSKSVIQAENLLREYEAFYEEKKNVVFYEFNKYALRSVRAYMHNCLFSLKCKSLDLYDFKTIKSDLENIRMVQNECMIHNYHPYKKAVEYAVKSIEKDIEDRNDRKTIDKKMICLKSWQKTYRENVDWCYQNQRYAFQLTFRECTEVGKNYKVFHPSSFSRPLKFKDIYKKRDEIDLKISMLEFELTKYEDVLSVKEAQEKVNNIERKNMEQMGLFATISTFLVGLLSIFIGNNGQVSIVEKMRYVIALGLILLIFVSVGYFVVREEYSKSKCWIFGGLLAFSVASILGICWMPNDDNIKNGEISSEVGLRNVHTEKDANKSKQTIAVTKNTKGNAIK